MTSSPTRCAIRGDARHLASLVDPAARGLVAMVLTSPYGPSVHGSAAMRDIFTEASRVLRPGGIVALTVRPWWRAGELVDPPGLLARVGEQAGLTLFERNVALLAGVRDDLLVPRVSFFALDQVRRARARGIPRSVIPHEDLLVFRRGRR